MINQRYIYRTGGAMLDLIVAALLTTTLIGALTTFTVRSNRLMADTRRHHFAIDELSNQLEQLLVLDIEAREAQIKTLRPSDEAAIVLPNAVIAAEIVDDPLGQRIVLSLNWDRGAIANPIRLVGWIKPKPEELSP
jgi:hypothetical protein